MGLSFCYVEMFRPLYAFVGSPCLLLDSQLPSAGALFRGESVSLSVVGHSCWSFGRGREVVGGRAGL